MAQCGPSTIAVVLWSTINLSSGERRMARRRPSDSSANSLPGRHGGLAERNTVNLDAFVSDVYLPHVQLRKRSWQVDARIARQHLSPAFGDRGLPTLSLMKWKNGCGICRSRDWPRPPATAPLPYSKVSAPWRARTACCPSAIALCGRASL